MVHLVIKLVHEHINIGWIARHLIMAQPCLPIHRTGIPFAVRDPCNAGLNHGVQIFVRNPDRITEPQNRIN